MQYPRIFKSPNLTRVFGAWQEEDLKYWHHRVGEIFGRTISVCVEATDENELPAGCRINPLEWQVLDELCNILRCSRSSWRFWTVELVEKAIPDLVKACIWKNAILQEPTYYRDVVNRYAEEGLGFLKGLTDYFTRYSQDQKASTRRHLVNRYLAAPYTDGDAHAILIRALRCFVTLRVNRKSKQEYLFRFTPDLRLSLWGRVFDKYLYEQLCLYIYLFRNQEEAHFFLERRQQLVNFVSTRLPPNHEDLAEVIVGETFDYLIKRRNAYSKVPDEIWIDTGLDTFFIGNILSSKRIQRFWGKRKRMDEQFDEEECCGQDSQYDDDVSVRPKKSAAVSQTRDFSSSGNSERNRLLRYYVNKLEPACRSYFQWEFFGIQTDGKEAFETLRMNDIEKPCLKKLRDILIENGYYDLFVK
ncbi:hypothetical protein GCM10023091_21240 [Ravibacter arvi]|uniref:Uncharacterized protein n=1 Tax=Ravibacter arvi TaxID=2051041 RepID=A0ABP8LZC4_9BACT